jgi:hypothetical protein
MPEYDPSNPVMTGHPPDPPRKGAAGWYRDATGMRWWFWDGRQWTAYEWGERPSAAPVSDA